MEPVSFGLAIFATIQMTFRWVVQRLILHTVQQLLDGKSGEGLMNIDLQLRRETCQGMQDVPERGCRNLKAREHHRIDLVSDLEAG